MSRVEKSLVVVEIDSLEGMGQARLSQLTNDELRKLCAERGLDTTGIKADLVSRIMYWVCFCFSFEFPPSLLYSLIYVLEKENLWSENW